MKHLDTFSGIGGFALAARWLGWETVGFCEMDPFCRRVLAKHWPGVPIVRDIHFLAKHAHRLRGGVDIVTGGVPCQPASLAGKRQGSADDRWLWPARPGEEQREWEAPRTVKGQKDRAARLKSLGNAVVPAVAYAILRAIQEAETA